LAAALLDDRFAVVDARPDRVAGMSRRLSFGYDGDDGLGDRLLAAVLRGEKTATTSLAVEYLSGDPLPQVGERLTIEDHDRRGHGVVETIAVAIVPLDLVGDDVAREEGEGFADASAWRRDHIAFWRDVTDLVRADARDPTWQLHQGEPVVVHRFRLLQVYEQALPPTDAPRRQPVVHGLGVARAAEGERHVPRAIQVRSAIVDDEQALARIDLATWTSDVSPSPATDRPFFGPHTSPADVLVAESGGVILGYAKLHQPLPLPSHSHVLELGGLAVDPGHQRTGAGRALVHAVVQQARARGARKLSLRVLGPNVTARRLYEACGFTVEGVLRAEFLLDGGYRDDVLMAHNLTTHD